ncbi:MAG: sulfotransferase domain-containing protein [Chloroflexi bacterium]|nr:sulfotransferase domain-containing protein [Chloroflexota bacterium]
MSELTRVYFGHHKCASRYIMTVFGHSTRLLGLTRGRPDQAADVCLVWNANAEVLRAVQTAGPYRGFHVIRDPRDIVVSGYFSHLYSHPISQDGDKFSRWRNRLAETNTIEEGLLLELDFEGENFNNIASWNYADPNVYETRFEQLIVDPSATFMEIFEFLGIQISRTHWLLTSGVAAEMAVRLLGKRPLRRRTFLPYALFASILWRNSFERKTRGRHQGVEDIKHHYRKGVAGDWRNYFTLRVKGAFKERYGGLLCQLGYEDNLDW